MPGNAGLRGVIVPRKFYGTAALQHDIAFGGGNGDFFAVGAFADEDAGRVAAKVGNGGHSLRQREEIARAVPCNHEIGGFQTAAQLGNQFRKLCGDHPRHGAGTADIEMGVVLPPVGPAGIGSRRNPHIIRLRSLVAQRRNPRAGQPLGVDQHDALFGGHTAHGGGIRSVGVVPAHRR